MVKCTYDKVRPEIVLHVPPPPLRPPQMVDLGRTQVEDAHALEVLLPSCPKLQNLGSRHNTDLMRSLSPLHSAAALDAQVMALFVVLGVANLTTWKVKREKTKSILICCERRMHRCV